MTSEIPGASAHSMPAANRLRRSRRLWRIAAFVALAVAVVAIAARFGAEQGALGERIARIEIVGTITTDPARLQAIADLANDPLVRAVVVDINSPGGTTAGGEELYEALGALRTSKPVVAVIRELGASAAYMTAIASDRIFSRRLSIVGSIGVLYQHVNAGKLLDTIGIDFDKVASGPLKAEPDYDEPMTGPARESIAALVMNSYEWFVDVVAERRGLPRPEALVLADGRIVSGRVALDVRLIDAIGGEAEALAWLVAERGVPVGLPVITYYPLPDNSLGGIWRYFGMETRSALGLPATGPIALDGLVSLWQVGPSL